MEDIFDMYPLDSISLKKACNDKDFSLVNIQEDHWIFSYTFRSNNKKEISFLRTFPKDTTASKHLQYHFLSYKSYNKLRKQIRENGFTFTREQKKDYGSVAYSREYYRNDVFEIALEEQLHQGPHSFTLMLYKIPDVERRKE
ncbi:hypothetical protein F0L74_06090 [Chitinophaga agrisoli]|uniref:Uncharacterized protein n=2 Tax=Chitinophaga agrisoli TaxID=2607653 RepID=A0A5B2W572_9BACT|nr:hypothetical protein F0L74_06090 [Chitinophaga agrisoli]